MSELNLIIRTADKARKAEITVADTQTCGDIIQAALENWALPSDTEYTVTNVTNVPAVNLHAENSLAKAGVKANDTLEIQPVLVAGGSLR